MRMLATLVLGASALAVAATASAQVKKPAADAPIRQVPAAGQTMKAAPVPANPEGSVNAPLPLFKIGNVPVDVWTPLEPPYDSRMNRDQAANPIWDEEAF
jgi:hypothetical protein